MSEQPANQGAPVDLSLEARLRLIRQQFPAAWQEALKGRHAPLIDGFLLLVPESDRPALRRELELIDRDFRQQLLARTTPAPGADATLDLAPSPAAPANLDATVEIASSPDGAPAAMDLDQTIDLGQSQPPASGSREAKPITDHDTQPGLQQTVDPAPASALGATVALSEAQDLSDADFSIGPQKPAPAAPDRLALIGYEILGELGRGGMGVVYKARQIKLNRLVALKMVLAGAHAGPEQLARFYTEAEAVAGLQHPNVVQIYEVGEQNGLPYFSLEFVDSGSLADKLGGKPQPPRDTAETMELLALAMACAHQHGIIHRDLLAHRP